MGKAAIPEGGEMVSIVESAASKARRRRAAHGLRAGWALLDLFVHNHSPNVAAKKPTAATASITRSGV
jgi:hypothetical protein